MSKLVKGVKKVFKKVNNFQKKVRGVIKKRWKLIVIAAAVYFTAGVALSYFPSTAAFASSMPGFGTGGVLAKAAVWMGFNGSATVASGLSMTSGAFAAGTAAAGTIVPYGTLAADAAATLTPVPPPTASVIPSGIGTPATVTQAMNSAPAAANIGDMSGAVTEQIITGGAGPGGVGPGGVGPGGAGPGGGLSATDAFIKSMTTAYKLQIGSTLLKTAAGLLAPSEKELMKKRHELEWGNAFGVGRDGSSEFGWASTGGSDAFKGMGFTDHPSKYAARGGEGFLDSPYNAKSKAEVNPYTNMDTQQQDFFPAPTGVA
jgi:hypothetical protein